MYDFMISILKHVTPIHSIKGFLKPMKMIVARI